MVEEVKDLDFLCEVFYNNGQGIKVYAIVLGEYNEEVYHPIGLLALVYPYDHANTMHFRKVTDGELTKRILAEGKRDETPQKKSQVTNL